MHTLPAFRLGDGPSKAPHRQTEQAHRGNPICSVPGEGGCWVLCPGFVTLRLVSCVLREGGERTRFNLGEGLLFLFHLQAAHFHCPIGSVCSVCRLTPALALHVHI